jgi:hypothetical protein
MNAPSAAAMLDGLTAHQATAASGATQSAVKPVTSAGGRISATTPARTGQGSVKNTQAEAAVHASPALPVSPALESAVLGRNPAAFQSSSRGENFSDDNTGSAPGTPTVHETFAALDSAPASAPAWVRAGAREAEAGFHDPELGWVSVRANSTSGAVHAAVVPGSDEAAQALGGHLAGLNDYLATHHSTVESVTLAAPEVAAASSSYQAGNNPQQGGNANSFNQPSAQQNAMNQNMGQGSGQNAQPGSGQNASSSQQNTVSAPLYAGNEFSTGSDLGNLAAPLSATGGTHISVMA